MRFKKNSPKDLALTMGYTLLMVVLLSFWATAFKWVGNEFGTLALAVFLAIGAPLFLTAVYFGYEALGTMRIEEDE